MRLLRRLRSAVERTIRGHLQVGPVVLYGANAMHWAVNVRTPLGYACARLPQRAWPWYFYVSHNATPGGAWVALGPGVDQDDRRRARVRQMLVVALVQAALRHPGVSEDEEVGREQEE